MHLEPAILHATSFHCPNCRPSARSLSSGVLTRTTSRPFGNSTNGLLEDCFAWAESVRVTRDSWQNGVRNSFQGACFERGNADLSALITSAIEDVLRDNTVEVVYHRTCSAKHTALALMCQKCKFTTQIQIGQASKVPFDKLQVVRRALACSLGIVAPASAVDAGY